MGIVDFFKGHSSKDIRLKQDISTYLVFPFPLKKNKVYLGKKAEVPENCVLVFCSKGKILDVLPTGEHKLGATILPNCSSKFKLYKPNKKGQEITEFKAFVYFIKTDAKKNFLFSTYKKVRYDNEIDGKFWIKSDFELDYQVSDYKKLLKSLLCEYAYLKTGEAEEIFQEWLSEFVTTELERLPYRRIDFEQRKDDVLKLLNDKLAKMLDGIGIKLDDLRILELIISKNKQENKNPLLTTENLTNFEEIHLENSAKAEKIYESNEVASILSLEQQMLRENRTYTENLTKQPPKKSKATQTKQLEDDFAKTEVKIENIEAKSDLEKFENALLEIEESSWIGLEDLGKNNEK